MEEKLFEIIIQNNDCILDSETEKKLLSLGCLIVTSRFLNKKDYFWFITNYFSHNQYSTFMGNKYVYVPQDLAERIVILGGLP